MNYGVIAAYFVATSAWRLASPDVVRRRMKMKAIMTVMLARAVAVIGCGRKSQPSSAGVPVSTNTVLPWLRKAEVQAALAVPEMTYHSEGIIQEPSPIDQQEQEQKRIRGMALIDDLKKEDQPGQQTHGN